MDAAVTVLPPLLFLLLFWVPKKISPRRIMLPTCNSASDYASVGKSTESAAMFTRECLERETEHAHSEAAEYLLHSPFLLGLFPLNAFCAHFYLFPPHPLTARRASHLSSARAERVGHVGL